MFFARSAALLGFLTALMAVAARAQTIVEPFTGTTAPGWVFAGNDFDNNGTVDFSPTLTAGTSIDPTGPGWLRLTDGAANRATSAYYDTALTSANRTFFTSFEFSHYGTTVGLGADGITFFLFDGSVAFDVGAFGGSMGYAQKTTAAGGEVNKEGLAGGYLAISLDDYGNFSNPTEGRIGGSGANPNAVVVRGPGSGYEGYTFIAATGDGTNAALPEQMDFPSAGSRPDQTGADYRKAEILISPTNQLTVWMQFGATSTLTKVLEADLSGYLRPETLKFGFTSGTGAGNEVHELRALTVATLVANVWDNGAGTSTWAGAGNWDPDFVPGQYSDLLFDNSSVTTAQTIAVGGPRDVRSIQIDAPFSYTLDGGALNFDDGGLPGFVGINVTQTNGVAAGGNTLDSALTLADPTTIRNATTSTLTLGSTATIDTNGQTLAFDGSGDVTANGVISDTGSVVKTGAGTVTLNAANTYSGGTALSTGTLAVGNNSGLGTGTLTLTGGRLTSTGNNTLSNAVSLQGNASLSAVNLGATGSLAQTGGSHTLGLNGVTLAGGVSLAENNATRTLTLDVGTNHATVSGVIANGAGTGADGLAKTGAGILTLSGANTYTGATTISQGEVRLGASDRLADTSAVVLGGGTLNLATNSERVGNLSWTGDSSLDFGTGGTGNALLVNNLASASGVLTINNWTSGTDFFGSLTGGITTPLDSIYFSGYAPGATLAGSSTANPFGYTGSFFEITPLASTDWYTWDSGNNSNRWDRGDNWSHPTGSLNNTVPTTNAKVAFGTGTQTAVDLRSNRTVNALRFNPGAAAFTLSDNTLTFSSSSTTGIAVLQQQSSNQQTINSAVTLARNTVMDVTGSGTMLINGNIGGTGNLVKEGTGGSLLLRGANTFTGDVFINSGTLRAGSNGALGAGDTTVADGATLSLASASTAGATTTTALTLSNALTLSGGGAGGGGAVRNLANTNTLSGAVTLAADTRLQSDAGTLILSNTISGSGRALTLAGAGATTLSGSLQTGTGTLTKEGAGTLTLSGATSNTFTGATTVNGGTLSLAKTGGALAVTGTLTIGDGDGTDTVRLLGSNQIAATSSVTLNAGGVLNLNGNSNTIGSLSASAAGAQVQLGTGALTVNNSASNAYAGSLAGSGTFNKDGVGRLTLSGASTSFTGTTSINAGIVALQSATALGDDATNTISVAGGANLELQGGITVANNLTLRGNGSGANDGALENVSGNSTVTGALTLATDARVQSSAGTLTLAGGISGTNTTLTVGGAGDVVLAGGVATGAGGLIKEGGGTLTLVGASTSTGLTQIGAGTLLLGASDRLADTSALSVATGAVLDLDGYAERVLTLSGGGAVDFGGGTLTLGPAANLAGAAAGTFSGSFVGAGTLRIADADTTASDYTLTLGAAFTNNSLGIDLAGGTLDLGGYRHAFGALTVTQNSILDFAGVSSIDFASISIAAGVTLTITNWTDAVDYFFSDTTYTQGSAPLNQIVFAGGSPTWTASNTKWLPYDGSKGQITPVPEPSTYGALFIGLTIAAFLWRRHRLQRTPAAGAGSGGGV